MQSSLIDCDMSWTEEVADSRFPVKALCRVSDVGASIYNPLKSVMNVLHNTIYNDSKISGGSLQIWSLVRNKNSSEVILDSTRLHTITKS